MRKSNFALRLEPSLLAEARKVAEAEGVALNQLINVALAEKLSALRTASYFAERAASANIPEALRILDRAGVGARPRSVRALSALRLLMYQIGGGLRRRCARRQASNPTKPTASRLKVPGSGTPSASAAAAAMIAWSAVVG